MRRNMSPTDSDVRGVILAPIAIIFAVGSGLETVAGILGITAAVALLLTAFVGYCPIYDLFGSSESQPA